MSIRFFYNGLKVEGNPKLVKAHYYLIERWESNGRVIEDQLVICARGYESFPEEVHKTFDVENCTDYQTDYIFDNDRARVHPDHPLFPEVFRAFEQQQERTLKRCEKYNNEVQARITRNDIERARAMLRS